MMFLATGLTARHPGRVVCFSASFGRFEAFFHKMLHVRSDGMEMLQLCFVLRLLFAVFPGTISEPGWDRRVSDLDEAIDPEQKSD